MSKFQLCTTLGDRKNAEKPKRKFSEFFGSVGSVFLSVRSILGPRVVVDRSGKEEDAKTAEAVTISLAKAIGCQSIDGLEKALAWSDQLQSIHF